MFNNYYIVELESENLHMTVRKVFTDFKKAEHCANHSAYILEGDRMEEVIRRSIVRVDVV